MIVNIKTVGAEIVSDLTEGCGGIFSDCGGFGIGRTVQTDDGYQLVVLGEKEMESVSITDKQGSYFYIRYRETKATLRLKKKQTRSCGFDYEKVYKLRLVAVLKCIPSLIAEECILNQLNNFDFDTCKCDGCIILKKTETDFDLILEEEYKLPTDDNCYFSKDVNLLCVDFDLIHDLCEIECEEIDYLCQKYCC